MLLRLDWNVQGFIEFISGRLLYQSRDLGDFMLPVLSDMLKSGSGI